MRALQLQLGEEIAAPQVSRRAATGEQRQAIEARDRDVLLEAGAGTGKTLVLIERYCAAAEEEGIDAILAFTFTERAAAELRHRIRAELATRARGAAERGDADRAALLATMSRDSERAWISTIHGFCRRLLASHPVPLGLDPRFRVLDEGEADRVAMRAFGDALDELLAAPESAAAGLVAAIGFAPLRELVRNAHDELRSLGVPRPELPDLPEPDPEAAVRELVSAARAALEETSESRGGRENLDRIARAAELDPDSIPTERELIGVELSSRAKAFSGPACRRYRDAWRAARRAVVERESADLYVHLARLVRAFGARFSELKEERSGLDFEDLQLEAVRLLRDRPALADSYRERLRHVMVDEFQDTNEVQLELVRLLQGPETRVFAVGDEFQSIYGFRHADLRVFQRERDRIRAQPGERAALLPLSGNFRSAPEIVAAANFVGRTLLDGYRPITVPAGSEHPGGMVDGAVEILLTPGGSEWRDERLGIEVSGDYPSAPDRIAEARFLAARLRELHYAHGVPRGEMVVLLRAFTHVAPFEDELERAGLAPYVVGGRGYWSQQQVDDVRRILGVIANPLDDDCLLGTLSSPACAVLPDTLWLLRQAAGRNRHLWPTIERRFGRGEPAEDEEAERWIAAIPDRDAERLSAFCTVLAELRDDAPRLGLEELTERALTRLGYDLATLLMRGGRRRLANTRKLMRMARHYESAEGRDLRGFLDFLADASGRSEREGEAATEAEEHDGVRVMTVHAAKGLEFPVVAVADLGRDLLVGGRPPAIRFDRADDESGVRVGIRLARIGAKAVGLYAYDELTEQAAEDEAAESCRLAYVAATRAQRHLILSGCYKAARLSKPPSDDGLPTGTPVTERLLRRLGIAEPDDQRVEVPGARNAPDTSPRPAAIALRVNRPDPEAFGRLDATRAPADEPGATIGGRPPIVAPRRVPPPVGHLSYSALASYGRCGYRFYAERVLALPGPDREIDPDGEPTGSARRFGFGTAVHALLEWSARHGWREPGDDVCAEVLRGERLVAIGAERERARAMVAAWLGSELCGELRETGARVRPEMPFLLPLGGSIVRGAIDLLANTPEGPLVVDYKTDSLADADPSELVDRYAVQRGIYALAASAEGGATVRTAFAFLDGGGECVARTFGAEELAAERSELERLVAGVDDARFDVTDSPHWALCHDCPARRRLCSHGKELTGRRLR